MTEFEDQVLKNILAMTNRIVNLNFAIHTISRQNDFIDRVTILKHTTVIRR